MSRTVHRLLAAATAALLGLCVAATARAETITSTATLKYRTGGVERTLASNTIKLQMTPYSTASVATFLRPVEAGAPVSVDGAACRMADGSYRPAPDGDGAARALAPSSSFHAGEDVFFQVDDGDRNADAEIRDTIEVRVGAAPNDVETVRLMETGPNTGVFAGRLPTRSGAQPVVVGDCVLSVGVGVRVSLEYGDTRDSQDVSRSEALVDPYGVTFDSETGEVLDGVRVSLLDERTGQPAAVFGDDGVSPYPSTVVSGQAVRDAGGAVYPAVKGSYRFPLVASGRYRLVVEGPAGWKAPSTADPASLERRLAPNGAELAISAASFGGAFDLLGPVPLRVDLPLDPIRQGLLLEKTASVATASAGDFVQFRMTLRNPNGHRPLAGAKVEAVLPEGLRVQNASVRVDGRAVPLVLSGRTLTIPLGSLAPNSRVEMAYVAQVQAATRPGLLVSRARASTAVRLTSNEALASIQVTPLLMSGVVTLVGRVTAGECGAPGPGVPGVRILLQDGSYTVTDDDGLYHLEGAPAGINVVQMDVARLPPGFKASSCGRSTRAAGRSFSEFVDAGGGALWRTDFRLERTGDLPNSPKPIPTRSAQQGDAAAAGAETDFLADATPGVGWLFPAADHNPRAPTVRVALKHGPGQAVALKINGEAVAPLSFDGVQTSAGSAVAVSVWRGVPLVEGSNTLTAVVSGAGQPSVTLERTVHYANTAVRATLAPERSKLSADGVTRPVIAVRFTDAAGRPVRAGSTGAFRVDAPFRAAVEVDAEQARQLAGQDRYATTWRAHDDDGVALIELAPTTQTGSVHLTFDFLGQRDSRSQLLRAWLEPGQRDWVIVGFAAGSAGYDVLRDHASPVPVSASDALTTDGQVSLFAKGRIGGDWLLTLAYDSEKRPDRDGRRSLQSVIDPTRYYTVYGDGSEQGYDASSAKKLYLRLERRQVYALFGDFETGMTESKLSRYGRSLTGLKAERQGEVVSATAFAANTDLRYAREELRGSGLAGLYRLSRRDIVLNSDRIRIEVRDRFRSERVLEVRSLTRHIDYDIDYDTGGLTFRQPILSRDGDLNPIFVVAEYETLGAAGENLNAGGRITASLRDGTAVLGVTAVHDEDDVSRTDLLGVDLKVEVRPGTEIRLEVAGTRGGSSRSVDGPIRTGSAYLAEIEHRGVRLDALAYAREQQSGFGLGQQSVIEAGSRKIGADVRYDLTEQITVVGAAYFETFEAGGERSVAEGSLERRTEDTTLRAGGRRVVDRVGSRELTSEQLVLGVSRRLLDRRLELSGERSFSLSGEGESVDFPDRTRIGAAYALRDDVRLIASHEISAGEAFDAANTQFGFDVAPWGGASLIASLNQSAIKESGQRTFALLGLRQALVLGENWGADLSLDSGRTLAGRIDPALAPNPLQPRASGGSPVGLGPVEDFWAVSAGGAYRSETWTWNGRAEYRDGDAAERFSVQTGFLRQTRSGVAFAAGARASKIEGLETGSIATAAVDLSWAYRPLDTPWSLLNKLELRVDELEDGRAAELLGPTRLNPGGDAKSRRIINNFALNYTPDPTRGLRPLQASLYYGAKYVMDRYDTADYDGYTDVFGLEVRRDLNRLFDVGFNAAVQHSWEADVVAYSYGPSIGVAPFANAWLSVGYNVAGFDDPDFETARYTRQGPYATLRFKFDQLTPGELRNALRPRGRKPPTRSSDDGLVR